MLKLDADSFFSDLICTIHKPCAPGEFGETSAGMIDNAIGTNLKVNATYYNAGVEHEDVCLIHLVFAHQDTLWATVEYNRRQWVIHAWDVNPAEWRYETRANESWAFALKRLFEEVKTHIANGIREATELPHLSEDQIDWDASLLRCTLFDELLVTSRMNPDGTLRLKRVEKMPNALKEVSLARA